MYIRLIFCTVRAALPERPICNIAFIGIESELKEAAPLRARGRRAAGALSMLRWPGLTAPVEFVHSLCATVLK